MHLTNAWAVDQEHEWAWHNGRAFLEYLGLTGVGRHLHHPLGGETPVAAGHIVMTHSWALPAQCLGHPVSGWELRWYLMLDRGRAGLSCAGGGRPRRPLREKTAMVAGQIGAMDSWVLM